MATKKFYIIFVIAPTFVWLWGAVLVMLWCSVNGPPFGSACKAAFWGAGAATPFHVFSAHLFICIVYPKNILIDRHEVAGSKRVTYGFVFLAPFVSILGVIWMYVASGSSEILVRIPLFVAATVFLAVVAYVPLILMLRAKRKSDTMKAVNFYKKRTGAGVVSIIKTNDEDKVARFLREQNPGENGLSEEGSYSNISAITSWKIKSCDSLAAAFPALFTSRM